ncbi:alpha/beta hydrolase [Kribbella sp. NPDC004875]|uniref:alpha/beta hydrolase n=1 Tax=Kribbella sp. NPDC004875 TaxID=3364107 RepID=UPI00367C2783
MAEADQLAERFRANLAVLEAARGRLQAAFDAGTATAEQRKRLATVKELLAPVTVSEKDADGNVVGVQRQRQFLKVDPEGQGRAIEVLGELPKAKHVAVLVPGMGNSLDTFSGQADRGDLIKQEAGPGTAVIVWLDYRSPQGLLEAAEDDAAAEGGPQLKEFLDEVDELKAEKADVTVVAHSYGTKVAGVALELGARPPQVVMTGSPGIDKHVDEASDFVTPATTLYVERAPGDYVALSEWHGPDPATFADAIRMETNDPLARDEAVSVRWHNEYYRPTSEALRNIGRVIAGKLNEITRTNTSRAAETKLLLGASWGDAFNAAAKTASRVFDGLAALTKHHRHPSDTPSAPSGREKAPVNAGELSAGGPPSAGPDAGGPPGATPTTGAGPDTGGAPGAGPGTGSPAGAGPSAGGSRGAGSSVGERAPGWSSAEQRAGERGVVGRGVTGRGADGRGSIGGSRAAGTGRSRPSGGGRG